MGTPPLVPQALCLTLSALSLCVLSCSVHLPAHRRHTDSGSRDQFPAASAEGGTVVSSAWGRVLQEADDVTLAGAPGNPRALPRRGPRRARRLQSQVEAELADSLDQHAPPSIPACAATSAGLVLANRQPLVDLSTGLNVTKWNASAVDAACQTWPGICCDTYGQVKGVSTATLNASGTIPASITQLAALTSLRLEQAQLAQPIPSFLSSLALLQDLSFRATASQTEHFQDLGWIGELRALTSLTLSDSALRGFIPDELIPLSALMSLDVSNTGLEVFPCWLSVFSNLQVLEAYDTKIYGTIPLDITFMPSLRHVDMSNNQLFGDLYAEFGNLTNLLHLDLGNNGIASSIPGTFGRLKNLSTLVLTNNSLHGSIPQTLANISALVNLQLSENLLELPFPTFAAATSLQILNISHNNFSGPLDLLKVAAAPNLEYLNMAYNNLSGVTPSPEVVQFFDNIFPAIKGLWLDDNGQVGPIDIFYKSPTLRALGLSRNGFNGTIPGPYSLLTNLEELDISYNSITGPVPEFLLTYLTTLRDLEITRNQLNGTIPASIAKWAASDLDLSHNNFSGEVPAGIGTLTQLQSLDLSFNQLSGAPDWGALLGGMTNASAILVNNNQFSGPLPVLEAHPVLQTLNLGNNSFAGSVPDAISALTALTGLFLSNNMLESSLPESLSGLGSLHALFAEGNRISGEVPDFLGSMVGLQFLSLSNNQLVGHIPPGLCNLNNLTYIDLAGNSLHDQIPSCLYLKPGLRVLDLSHNFFFNTLTNQFITFDPAYGGVLDLSNNYIYGSPPQFFNTTYNSLCEGGTSPVQTVAFPGIPVVYQGSSSLAFNCFAQGPDEPCEVAALLGTQRSQLACASFCGISTSDQCGGYGTCNPDSNRTGYQPGDFQCQCVAGFVEVHLPDDVETCQVAPSDSLSAGAIAGIVVGCVSAVAAVVLLWVYVEQRRKWQSAHRWKNLNVCEQFTLARVEKATNNWSQSNIIGEGSYGTVYRGVPKGGTSSGVVEEWAVKRAKLLTNEFEVEVRAMATLHHKNLVRLVGFCTDYNNSSGVQEQILIYEYVANGDLGMHLYDRRKKEPISLDRRLQVAIGAAEGIAYLHSFEPPVVHRDVKPENILLDDNFEAKVADFGLLKRMESMQSATRVAGTPGYVDPEYNKTKTVSTKTDVYSFGIVLLEMITGRRPLIQVSRDEHQPPMHIVQWVRPHFEDWDGDALADPVLLAPSDAILEMTLLAIDCVRCPAMARPEMRDIVTRLQEIRNKYQGLLEDVVFVKQFDNPGGSQQGNSQSNQGSRVSGRGGGGASGVGGCGVAGVGGCGVAGVSASGGLGSRQSTQGIPVYEEVPQDAHPHGSAVGHLDQDERGAEIDEYEEDALARRFDMMHNTTRSFMDDHNTGDAAV